MKVLIRTHFYDRYHLKNKQFFKVIRRGNFTYFYTLDFLHKACPEGFSSKKILDVGCGVGTLSLYVASQGAEVVGIDISPRAIDIAQQAQQTLAFKEVTFMVKELTKGKADQDLVICSEVIEHIPDDKKFLQLIHSHLKKKGRLYLSTPSQENLLYKIGFYKKFDAEVGHLRRYTVQSLQHVIESQGFTILQLREVEGPLRNLLFTTKLGFLIKFIRGPLVPVFHWFDQISATIAGASDLQVIAEKK